MTADANSNLEAIALLKMRQSRTSASIHPSWLRLIRYCAELGHGEIEKLKIQDGVPVIADVVREKVKFT